MDDLDPIVVVIDDDPMLAAALRAAAPPTWEIAAAHDGVTGLDLVRAMRAVRRVVVVLDFRMPHDGVLTAITLRAETPETPIIPCTAYAEYAPIFSDLGCLTPLIKPVSGDQVCAAVARALRFDWLALPPTPHPVWRYVSALAQRQETEQRRRRGGALLLAATATRQAILTPLAAQAQLPPLCCGGRRETAQMRRLAQEHPVNLIVTDDSEMHAALDLASECQAPLAVYCMVPHLGYAAARLVQERLAAGVVLLDPLPPERAAPLLARLAAAPFVGCDPRLAQALAALRPSLRPVAALMAEGGSNEWIERRLRLRQQTVRKYRQEVLAAIKPQDLVSWLDARLRDLPCPSPDPDSWCARAWERRRE